MRKHAFCTLSVLLAWSGVASASSWLSAPPSRRPFKADNALQLTDGSIMAHEYGTSNWWKLVPDNHADYVTGHWKQLASSTTPDLPRDYSPFAFESAVLPDGRVIVAGGEYTFPHGTITKTLTNQVAIYDPVADAWTPVPAPCHFVGNTCQTKTRWTKIGDAPSIVLANGTFMLGQRSSTKLALLDADSLTWSIVAPKGKFDENDEEGWTLLPPLGRNPREGNVLAIDTYLGVDQPYRRNSSEIYDPGTNTWKSARNTVKPLSYLVDICGTAGGHEVGPAVLRPDGTVFATGSSVCGSAHTAIYDSATGNWKGGPDIPDGNAMGDAPAALLQNGNVLVLASPGINKGPATFYEFDFKTAQFSEPVTPPPGYSGGSDEAGRMLVVSSGHVMFLHAGAPFNEMFCGHPGRRCDQIWFYTHVGTYDPLWQPLVEPIVGEICVGCIFTGHTYTIRGTQLNGLSQGAYYGDENPSASNYPLVQIENCQSGHKFFARTHGFSTMGVATGLFTIVSAKFDVLPGTETGASSLRVIANGIPSDPAGGRCAVTVWPARKGARGGRQPGGDLHSRKELLAPPQ